jgi:hypothetical protein
MSLRTEAARQNSMKWSPGPVPQYITVSQFAEATQIGESVVRQYNNEGRIRAVSLNGHNIRIEIGEIQRVMKPVAAKPSKAKRANENGDD